MTARLRIFLRWAAVRGFAHDGTRARARAYLRRWSGIL